MLNLDFKWYRWIISPKKVFEVFKKKKKKSYLYSILNFLLWLDLLFSPKYMVLSFKLCCALKNCNNFPDHFSAGILASKFKAETMNVLKRQFNTFNLFFFFSLSCTSWKISSICANICFTCQALVHGVLLWPSINIVNLSPSKSSFKEFWPGTHQNGVNYLTLFLFLFFNKGDKMQC